VSSKESAAGVPVVPRSAAFGFADNPVGGATTANTRRPCAVGTQLPERARTSASLREKRQRAWTPGAGNGAPGRKRAPAICVRTLEQRRLALAPRGSAAPPPTRRLTRAHRHRRAVSARHRTQAPARRRHHTSVRRRLRSES